MLTKRGKKGNWYARFTAPGGDRIFVTTGTTDRRAAEEFEARLKSELYRTQKLGEAPRRTWQEAVLRWVKYRANKRSLARDIREFRWLDPILGSLHLDQIRGEVIDRIITARMALNPDTGKAATAATCNRTLALVRAVLRAAHGEWEWLAKVPRIRLLPEPVKAPRWLTPGEAERLVRELPAHLVRMLRFALATGLRDQNVTKLTWAQVSGRAVSITAESAKGKRSMVVPLNEEALAVLEECRGDHPVWVFTYRPAVAGGAVGEPRPILRPNNSAFRKAVARAGLSGVNWHTLRHTWASWHAQAGTSPLVLKELGGWSSLSMVLRYAHLGQSHLAEHARAVGHQLRLVVDNTGANSVQNRGSPLPAAASG